MLCRPCSGQDQEQVLLLALLEQRLRRLELELALLQVQALPLWVHLPQERLVPPLLLLA